MLDSQGLQLRQRSSLRQALAPSFLRVFRHEVLNIGAVATSQGHPYALDQSLLGPFFFLDPGPWTRRSYSHDADGMAE